MSCLTLINTLSSLSSLHCILCFADLLVHGFNLGRRFSAPVVMVARFTVPFAWSTHRVCCFPVAVSKSVSFLFTVSTGICCSGTVFRDMAKPLTAKIISGARAVSNTRQELQLSRRVFPASLIAFLTLGKTSVSRTCSLCSWGLSRTASPLLGLLSPLW